MGESTTVERLLTPEEYLAGELTADVRSEYVGGRTYPMPGVSIVHAQIVTNLTIDIGGFLEDLTCRIYGSEVKFRRQSGPIYYYPDLMICCDPCDDASYWRERPRYVFESSSPETYRTDEGEKKLAYYHTASIESYIQLAQDTVRVVVNRRSLDTDFWISETLTKPDDLLRLDGLDYSLPLSRVYRHTDLIVTD